MTYIEYKIMEFEDALQKHIDEMKNAIDMLDYVNKQFEIIGENT